MAKKTTLDIKKMVENRLGDEQWRYIYDREKEELRIEGKESQKGMSVSLNSAVAKYEADGEAAFEELIYYVKEALSAMHSETVFLEEQIRPVIRATSFPTEKEEGNPFVTSEHTAETRIYYAIDSEKTYQLIDEKLLIKSGYTVEQIHSIALFNLRKLPIQVKEDIVADNTFYFVRTNDGYDASRVLSSSFLKEIQSKVEGELLIGIPHGDVLILADIRNNIGYDIMAQMNMSFFASGKVPITSLSFAYENEKLMPIFILGKQKKR
ncbi:DUF1444 family protein [Bacillus sp. EAC]|uniref:DUF1444 family protein n=1 Tax=Bacillus sp. EAC TaxID=1978338 RepID=UPI00358FCD4D